MPSVKDFVHVDIAHKQDDTGHLYVNTPCTKSKTHTFFNFISGQASQLPKTVFNFQSDVFNTVMLFMYAWFTRYARAVIT